MWFCGSNALTRLRSGSGSSFYCSPDAPGTGMNNSAPWADVRSERERSIQLKERWGPFRVSKQHLPGENSLWTRFLHVKTDSFSPEDSFGQKRVRKVIDYLEIQPEGKEVTLRSLLGDSCFPSLLLKSVLI